ncbi:LytTR family transcriptional regulator DNA-binding domain-containing protein [Lachnospiraceae bacterium NSJ-143]|nr:LytTR family transcriptional regulator DNA-binding domain-containing protein [Lachnospiraceae bacterium NSJ-143]
MRRPKITEEKIIQLTIENVRSFYNRNQKITTTPMTSDFMWIGSNDFQWCESLDEFYNITQKEYEEPPVILSDEEFHLLFHERNVWTIYGRYKATAVLDDGCVIHAHVRGTYIWRMVNGELKLAHVHGSHAQDIPLNQISPVAEPLTESSSFFDYMKHLDAAKTNVGKISFRDSSKNYRYLFPTEILYIKADGQYSIVYTKTDSFRVWGLLAEYEKKLPEIFRRIHKSYIVNSIFIESIKRYTAVVYNQLELPISKERYMDLKRYLQSNSQKS